MIRTPEEELQFRRDRQKYIGGSDMGALLGIAPQSWEINSPLKLYLAKIEEPTIDPFQKPQLRRGGRWEAVVAEMLEERLKDDGHTINIVGRNKQFRDKEFDHFRCEVDFELQLDEDPSFVSCELKTVHPFLSRDWGESDTDGVPIHFLAQVQWGLGITGREICIVAALFGADDLRTFPIHRDEDTIETLRLKAHEFWNDHVLARKPPPFQDITDVNALFKIDKVEMRDFSDILAFRHAYANLIAADNELTLAKIRRETFEKECKQLMGDAGIAMLFAQKVITWKSHKRSAIDVEILRNLHPTIARQCSQESTVRPFKLIRSRK